MPAPHSAEKSKRRLSDNHCTDRQKPVIELGDCTLCEGCVAACPEVFRVNDLGYMEVADLPCYPVDAVDDAIKNCPEDCIFWEDI